MGLRYVSQCEDATYDYYRVLKRYRTPERDNRAILSTLRGKGGAARPIAFQAKAQTLLNLQKSNSLRNVAGQNVQFTTGFISTDIAAQAMAGAAEQTSQSLALFIASMAYSADRKQGLARIHQEIAEKAHSAVVLEYNGKYGDKRQYRQGQNRESGKLGPAIRSRQWIAASRDGILYMDQAYLKRAAKHWYRLNFGSMPRGRQKLPKTYSMKFGGSTAGKLSLSENRPDKGFVVPKGLWMDSQGAVSPSMARRGMDSFYTPQWLRKMATGIPLKSAQAQDFKSSMENIRRVERKATGKDPGRTPFTKAVKSQGIRGGQFFDVGVKVIAREMGPAYEGLLEIWREEASSRGTGPVAKVIATSS